MDKAWGDIDRRGYTRVSVKDTELWIKRKEDQDLHFSGVGFMRDIGIGGMSFYSTPEELSLNEVVELRLKLQAPGFLQLKGKVVHIQETTYKGERLWIYGIEFSSLNKECRNIIKNYVLEKLSLDRFFEGAKKTAT